MSKDHPHDWPDDDHPHPYTPPGEKPPCDHAYGRADKETHAWVCALCGAFLWRIP